MEIINWKKFNYSDDIIYHWELLWDDIDGERGSVGIIGGKAAPEGVAAEIILFYKERGSGSMLWWYLFEMILGEYGFSFDYFIMDIIKEEKVVVDLHIQLNQYQQVKEKKVFILVVLY